MEIEERERMRWKETKEKENNLGSRILRKRRREIRE